jgi:hypothetical protein
MPPKRNARSASARHSGSAAVDAQAAQEVRLRAEIATHWLVTDKLRSYAAAFRRLRLHCPHEQGSEVESTTGAVAVGLQPFTVPGSFRRCRVPWAGARQPRIGLRWDLPRDRPASNLGSLRNSNWLKLRCSHARAMVQPWQVPFRSRWDREFESPLHQRGVGCEPNLAPWNRSPRPVPWSVFRRHALDPADVW